jgi:hypothetical protein
MLSSAAVGSVHLKVEACEEITTRSIAADETKFNTRLRIRGEKAEYSAVRAIIV